MIVVADTTPLNYLTRLGLVEILRELYGQVVLPAAVLFELQQSGSPPEVRQWIAEAPTWIVPGFVHQIDTSLNVALGAGEREAISLAKELGADLLLIDERAGRRAAQRRNLAVTGTLTVLSEASLRGLCDFEVALHELKRLGFWLSSDTETQIKARHQEAQLRSSSVADKD